VAIQTALGLVSPFQKAEPPHGLPRRFAPRNDEEGLDHGLSEIANRLYEPGFSSRQQKARKGIIMNGFGRLAVSVCGALLLCSCANVPPQLRALTCKNLPAGEEQFRAVQQALIDEGYDPGPPDGQMGRKTRDALRQFQADKSLPATGTADAATREALGFCREAVSAAPAAAAPPAEPQPAAARPAVDPQVQEVQRLLTERGYAPGPVDGLMGKRTQEALRRFQNDNGRSVSGKIDARTLEVLRPQPVSPVPAPLPEITPLPPMISPVPAPLPPPSTFPTPAPSSEGTEVFTTSPPASPAPVPPPPSLPPPASPTSVPSSESMDDFALPLPASPMPTPSSEITSPPSMISPAPTPPPVSPTPAPPPENAGEDDFALPPPASPMPASSSEITSPPPMISPAPTPPPVSPTPAPPPESAGEDDFALPPPASPMPASSSEIMLSP
jgi:peptidoglycan hydrolase-like protein with peptidoglycan-binding domain